MSGNNSSQIVVKTRQNGSVLESLEQKSAFAAYYKENDGSALGKQRKQ